MASQSRSILQKAITKNRNVITAPTARISQYVNNTASAITTNNKRSIRALSTTSSSQQQQSSSSCHDHLSLLPPLTAALAAITTVIHHQTDSSSPPTRNDTASTWGPPPTTTTLKKANNTDINKASQPRNVMLHRMRSVRARHMGEKYNVDWNTVLGEGAYGSVHPARLVSTNLKVALKKITKRYTNSHTFRSETNALLRIYDNGGHPNISGLRDMYEDFGHYYLILDLVAGGELFDHLIQFGAYSEADAARLMQEVTSALAFLHNVGVIHADLKPENLLLCSKQRGHSTVKIIDFGCAITSKDDTDNNNDAPLSSSSDSTPGAPPSTSIGTTAYWSPELFLPNATPSEASDMWALGIILFIMLCGVHPFDLSGTSTDEDIERQIKRHPHPPIGPITSHLSPSAIDLIQKLMNPDPKKRLTAEEMFNHPWIRGETATTEVMVGSDKKLSRFKQLRETLEAGIFAMLVKQGLPDHTISEAKRTITITNKTDGNTLRSSSAAAAIAANAASSLSNTSSSADIMKRAFDVFDASKTGVVTKDDLGKVMNNLTGMDYTADDLEDMITATIGDNSNHTNDDTTNSNGLSLSDFSQLFSRIKHKYYPRGHVIFHAGDEGSAMYFINAGRVEIRTRKGDLISILRPGDFFGEGSLLEDSNRRISTARTATPVDLIKISREEFERYVGKSTMVKSELKSKWKARSLSYAKNLIRLQTNVKTRDFKKGDVVYKEGDVGKSMFLVDEVDGGVLDVMHGEHRVLSYRNGESFGETSLLFTKPRSSTVVCASPTCKLHEMIGSDFLAVLESSPETAQSLRDMCRKRLFKRAIKGLARKKNRAGYEMDDIIDAFNEADKDGSGSLSLDELRQVMHNMDPDFPEEEVVALLKFIDMDEDGLCSLEDFKKLFRVFEMDRQEGEGGEEEG